MALDDLDRATRTREMLAAAHPIVPFEAGSAEPWVAELLAALLKANGTRTAIEIGGFMGATSVTIADALGELPWQTEFTVCEIDAARASQVQDRLDSLGLAKVHTKVVLEDSHRWIPTLPDFSVDFAWVDGNHELAHVKTELHLLYSKMRPGGLICGHDVHGVCQLWKAFQRFRGLSLDLPRLGPAGGIGIIQVPTDEQQLAYLDV